MSNAGPKPRRTLTIFASMSAALVVAVLGAAGASATAGGAAPSHGASAPSPLAIPAHIGGVVPPHGTGPVEPRVQDPLAYGGGRVMSQKEISYSIFWVPPTLQDGSPTYMSPTYQPLIERYFGDVGGHGLYGNNKQYYEVVNGVQINIRNRSSAGPVWVDTSPYPPSGCDDPATPGNCLSDLQIKQEVSSQQANT